MSFLSGEPMPVIESLIESYRKYSDGLEELGLARRWSHWGDSNSRPSDYESDALPG